VLVIAKQNKILQKIFAKNPDLNSGPERSPVGKKINMDESYSLPSMIRLYEIGGLCTATVLCVTFMSMRAIELHPWLCASVLTIWLYMEPRLIVIVGGAVFLCGILLPWLVAQFLARRCSRWLSNGDLHAALLRAAGFDSRSVCPLLYGPPRFPAAFALPREFILATYTNVNLQMDCSNFAVVTQMLPWAWMGSWFPCRFLVQPRVPGDLHEGADTWCQGLIEEVSERMQRLNIQLLFPRAVKVYIGDRDAKAREFWQNSTCNAKGHYVITNNEQSVSMWETGLDNRGIKEWFEVIKKHRTKFRPNNHTFDLVADSR
jgi:hypothetical protein